MYKLLIFASVICFASAGLIGHGLGSVAVAHAPVAVAHAPVAVAHTAHVAQSYANNHLISVHPVPIQVAHAAPLVHAAPAIAHAAPVLSVAAHGYSFGHGAGLHGYH